MTYPAEYINYLVHFHGDRDYFECHEELEELWKQDPKGKRKHHLVGLIQIAVSLYHHRRGNFSGAFRMMANAISIIEQNRKPLKEFGLNTETLIPILKERLNDIQNHVAYKSFNLPIGHPALIRICNEQCESLGFIWGSESQLDNIELIEKHKRRDRSEVIAERELQKLKKAQAPCSSPKNLSDTD
ncbi:DUF309 domain-containing protein [Litchfieldia salsa]|uniref:DUF309 domain-containing protein n=1 Tax=Litchfieldia salsa TaxID=930152 RepID=A0A1H0WGK9_9BACI|nr:DUF309 domain-containing protein [Litchfieldia salsa]SDP89777.1 hypothetical protein SAMN05216565_11169 [Litchfieldia salsa]